MHPYWISFFGSEDSFLESACRLEFVVYLNSYLATEVPEAKEWLDKWRPDYDFEYWYTSDLWRYRLDRIVGLAEKLYEYLESGLDHPFFFNFSVEHGVLQKRSIDTITSEVYKLPAKAKPVAGRSLHLSTTLPTRSPRLGARAGPAPQSQ